MCILAGLDHQGNSLAVKVTGAYTIGSTKYACVETVDGSTPFLTVGSKFSHHTAWTTVPGDQLRDVRCTHEHTIWDTSGAFHWSADCDPWDDIRETQYCLDCGQELTPAPAVSLSLVDVDELPF